MESPRFVIATPVRNAEKYVAMTLESIGLQQKADFRLHVVDDCSTDGTADVIREWMNRHRGVRTTFEANDHRRGALANLAHIVAHADRDEVVCFVDGDGDTLEHPLVLERLAERYASSDVWCTYGQFRYDTPWGSKGIGMACPIPREQHDRRSGWRSTHLKTSLAGLAQMIRPDDLRRPDGAWIDVAWDLALFYPIIEMAGPDHALFVDEVLYVYNMWSPGNDVKMKPEEQRYWQRHIEQKPIYPRLGRLPWRR